MKEYPESGQNTNQTIKSAKGHEAVLNERESVNGTRYKCNNQMIKNL